MFFFIVVRFWRIALTSRQTSGGSKEGMAMIDKNMRLFCVAICYAFFISLLGQVVNKDFFLMQLLIFVIICFISFGTSISNSIYLLQNFLSSRIVF